MAQARRVSYEMEIGEIRDKEIAKGNHAELERGDND
jgi:hypothetical protein